MEYIEVFRDDVPYSFNIRLSDTTYEFTLDYNTIGDFFTMEVKHNNKVLGIDKVVYGKPLFDNITYKNIPKVKLIPYSTEVEVDRVDFENFGTDVLLYVVGEEDEILD